ncbi:PTS sugar transporter subunit IIA [Nocardia huaxiensis]|uniref:Ascorbate-specific PTS system EIIA component n=1 Tax=Nocardia huaxiensis TaxID=2755382 RepID=A0A7D6ZYZ4_9NOCA|nr:PTS sugar transporter subunit IIA [Nocardia huaxiensis]QLY31989.1 PTS sugar transporter subunit IIA [Nocardia huaxiensis]
MTSLADLLPEDAIDLDGSASDWRAAIRVAGDLLVATGVTTSEYTDEMIRNVEDNGPYIVIAPGFAFAHARPSPAVRRTGMSWVRLREPVTFGSPNDPVDLVVALAAKDSGVHTDAMAELAKVLLEPGADRVLRAVGTPRQLRALLSDPDAPADRAEPAARTPAVAVPEAAPDVCETATTAVESGSGRRSGPVKILTVCGNGVGTSLFLKSTLEKVLARWHWSPYVNVEATDTISARGKAGEAVAVLTSGAIANALGELGIPVHVIENFTSTAEVDHAMREIFDVQEGAR